MNLKDRLQSLCRKQFGDGPRCKARRANLYRRECEAGRRLHQKAHFCTSSRHGQVHHQKSHQCRRRQWKLTTRWWGLNLMQFTPGSHEIVLLIIQRMEDYLARRRKHVLVEVEELETYLWCPTDVERTIDALAWKACDHEGRRRFTRKGTVAANV